MCGDRNGMCKTVQIPFCVLLTRHQTCRNVTPEWYHWELMHQVFSQMFSVTSKGVKYLIPLPEVMDWNGFYSFLLTPYFYQAVSRRKLKGKRRRLREGGDTAFSLRNAKMHSINVSKPCSIPPTWNGLDYFDLKGRNMYLVCPHEGERLNGNVLGNNVPLPPLISDCKTFRLIFVVPPKLF